MLLVEDSLVDGGVSTGEVMLCVQLGFLVKT